MNAHRPSAVWTSEPAGLEEGAGLSESLPEGDLRGGGWRRSWEDLACGFGRKRWGESGDRILEMRECVCREQGVLRGEV